MNRYVKRGLVLLALTLVLVTAAAGFHASVLIPPLLLFAGAMLVNLTLLGGVVEDSGFQTWKRFWVSELGEVKTLYFARSGIPGGPVLLNGSSAAPTAIQASQIPVLKVQLVMVDAITQATITHNWGLDKSSPTYFDPEIWYWLQNSTDGAPGATWLCVLTFDLTNTNVVLVNKIAGAAATPTGGTYLITLRNNAAMLNSAGGIG